MFPIKSNDPYIQKNGTRSTLGSVIGSGGGGGGGSDIPEHTSTDAGKVLGVNNSGNLAWVEVLPEYTSSDAGKVLGIDENGNLAWATVSGGNQFSFASGEYENWNANGKAGVANAN